MVEAAKLANLGQPMSAMQHFRFDGLPVDVKSEDVVQYYAKYEAGGQ